MSQIDSFERIILRQLFKATMPIKLYSYHENYLFSPAQLLSFLEKYQSNQWIIYENSSISLTQFGKESIWKNRDRLFDPKIKLWRPKNIKKNNEGELKIHFNWLDKNITKLDHESFMQELTKS